MTRNYLIAGTLVAMLLVALWWGVPTYRKVKADAMVDKLCAKDGGLTVYEKVALPAGRFDKNGNIQIPIEQKSGSDYYLVSESEWIVPYTGEGDISISRQIYKVYRANDKKLLGESVSYLRRGGDPISPAHLSSYRCPNDVGIERRVFIRD